MTIFLRFHQLMLISFLQFPLDSLFQHQDRRHAAESPGLIPIRSSRYPGRTAAFKGVFPVDPYGRGALDVAADRLVIIDRVVGNVGFDVQFRKHTVQILAELVIGAAYLGLIDIDLHN